MQRCKATRLHRRLLTAVSSADGRVGGYYAIRYDLRQDVGFYLPTGPSFRRSRFSMAGAAAYRPLRLEIEGRAFHSTLFARLHTSKAEDSDLPAQRTLFAVNVPHGATEAGLQAAFERLGAVSEVRLSSMTAEPASSSSSAAAAAPAVTSTAHVVFETAEALKATLKSTKALRLSLETAATTRSTESREVLQKAVDGFLKRFEAEEKKRAKEALDAKGKMDADGCAR